MNKIQKKIETFYKPLQKSGAIEIVGSVPALQTYQVDKSLYTPDYTLVPLVLFPRCNATDRDNLLALGTINSSLTNMKWYEIIGGAKTLIDTAVTTYYEITTSGTTKGQIKIKKNSTTLNPITLLFEADYVDSRNGDVYKYSYSKVIPCLDASDAAPVVMIDSPRTAIYNPLRDLAEQTITAKVLVGDLDVTNTAKCNIFWYRVLDNGTLDPVGLSGDNDWETVSIAKDSIKINREYIGYTQSYVVKATYDPAGNPAAAPGSTSPFTTTSIIRQIPKLEADWSNVKSGVANGTQYIYPKAIVRDTIGVLNDPSLLKPVWGVKKPGDSVYTRVAVGYSPTIQMYENMMLQLDIQDKGPLMVIVDGGVVVADGDGKILLDRLNP